MGGILKRNPGRLGNASANWSEVAGNYFRIYFLGTPTIENERDRVKGVWREVHRMENE